MQILLSIKYSLVSVLFANNVLHELKIFIIYFVTHIHTYIETKQQKTTTKYQIHAAFNLPISIEDTIDDNL